MSRKVAKLREKLDKALRKERFDDALARYDELMGLEPAEPRWPHRKGDLLRRLGREHTAIACYEKAVRCYADLGFVARAAAMAKVILQIDDSRVDVLERVDPEAAKRLHAEKRKVAEETMETRAVPLSPAEDADDDEIRFLDIDEDAAIEIEITEIELEPRQTTMDLDADDLILVDVGEAPSRTSAEELASLPSIALFAHVPQPALQKMLALSELVELGPGETIVALGEDADSLFVIIEGHADVKVPGLEAILLGDGDVIGESCLLEEVHRRADVVSSTAVQLLKVPKEVLDDLVEEHPAVGDVLLELLSRRLISNVLQTSPIFAAFDPGMRGELAKLFELRRADDGQILIEEGKRSDGLYCSLLGTLDVDGTKLGPGAVVGQASLLSHSAALATVRCETDVLLLRMPASRFNELAALYPPVLMYLSELATRPVEELGGALVG